MQQCNRAQGGRRSRHRQPADSLVPAWVCRLQSDTTPARWSQTCKPLKASAAPSAGASARFLLSLDRMKAKLSKAQAQAGKIGKIALLWLVGIPLPIAVLAIYLGGCD